MPDNRPGETSGLGYPFSLASALGAPAEPPPWPDGRDPAPPPPDFGFILAYGIGARNVLDTFNGRFTKDLVMDGTATIPLKPGALAMAWFHQAMADTGITGYPAAFEPDPNVIVTPAFLCRLQVRMNGKTTIVTYDGSRPTHDPRAAGFLALVSFIRTWVESTEGFRKMPPAKGAYL